MAQGGRFVESGVAAVMGKVPVILLLDNYDSFVHNLARYLRRLGHATEVVRSDATDATAIAAKGYDAIVLSPGPCTPSEAGCSMEVVQKLGPSTPIFGVCLGHQAIAAALGGKIVRAPRPMHGRSSLITHDGAGVFAGLPNPLQVGRYHSLVADEATLPKELVITARCEEGLIMGLRHQTWPLVGVQFHPESILTDKGYEMLAQFAKLAGLKSNEQILQSKELDEEQVQAKPLPSGPVTF